jgi:hypothetical protein
LEFGYYLEFVIWLLEFYWRSDGSHFRGNEKGLLVIS